MVTPEQKQIKWLLDAATSVFTNGSDSPKLDAELLLCEVLDCNRTYLFTWPDKELSDQQITRFRELCRRRENGEPIAHIIGKRDFWTLSLNVNNSTLIPRPDTEVVVETALAAIENLGLSKGIGLDLGTGTGAIALALSSELPNWNWYGCDLNKDAVLLAKSNAVLNDISNCEFLQSDWFSSVPKLKFDIIVSNPPYIDSNDPHLSQGDVRFEPLTALVAEDNGLSDIKHIVALAKTYLSKNGVLLLEHGFEQGVAVRNIFQLNGYKAIKTITDLSENDRVTIGYL